MGVLDAPATPFGALLVAEYTVLWATAVAGGYRDVLSGRFATGSRRAQIRVTGNNWYTDTTQRVYFAIYDATTGTFLRVIPVDATANAKYPLPPIEAEIAPNTPEHDYRFQVFQSTGGAGFFIESGLGYAKMRAEGGGAGASRGYSVAMRYDHAQYPGEWIADLAPVDYARDATIRGLIIDHGAAQDAFLAMTRSAAGSALDLHGQYALVCELARNFPMVVPDLGGGQTWGNDTAINAVGQARTFLHGAGGAKAGKDVLVGVSMGFLAAMNYARAFPGNVAGVVGILPVSDLNDIVTNNRGGFAGNVHAAYGGTYVEAVHGLTHNPTNYAATITVPVRLYYAINDTIVIPSTVTGLAAAIPGATATSLGALGHTEDAIAAVSPATIAGIVRGFA